MKIRITYVPEGGPRVSGWQAYHPSWGVARSVEGGSLDDLMNTLENVPVALTYSPRYTAYGDKEHEYPEWYTEYRWGE